MKAKYSKYRLSDYDNSYQLTLKGERYKAVITKFTDQKKWSVAFFWDLKDLSTTNVVDFKSLGDAKYAAEDHCEI